MAMARGGHALWESCMRSRQRVSIGGVPGHKTKLQGKSMIKIGVIGYGYWGPNLVRSMFEAAETTVVAVSDMREERLRLVHSR